MKRTLQNGFGMARRSPGEAYAAAFNVVESQIHARSGPSQFEPYEGDLATFEIEVAVQLVEDLLPEELATLFMLARAPQSAFDGLDDEDRLAWNESAGWLLAAWIETHPLQENEVLGFALEAENRLPFLFALASRREGGPLGEEALRRLEALVPRVGAEDGWWLAALLLRRGGPRSAERVRGLADRFPEWELPR